MGADAAVAFLLEQASAVIKGHPDLISGAEKEFKNLKNDVEELKAVLKDMGKDEHVENEIRETIYEVEDKIDSLLTQAASRGQRRGRQGQSDLSPEEQVRIMSEKVKAMRLCAQGVMGSTQKQQPMERASDLAIRQEKVVGLEDEEEKIKGYLRKEQPELDIIPIIGTPGLGKTALTWKMYNDEKICYEFPIRIWVQISKRFESGRDVLIQIMKHFTTNMNEVHNKSPRDLCDKVHECLSQDKFLLVVDDMWRMEHWDEIKDALPYGNANGKVIITSNEMAIGRHVKHITEPHALRRLHRDESWELLQLEVFGKLGRCPPALEGIGRVIVEKCDGIPMTIVVLGGVLKDQYLSLKSDILLKEKWEEVAANVDLVDVVALSYHRLPDRLRDCFLYLGVFPADYEIPAWTLMQLWIAEGFIQPDDNKSLEEIAEDNLNDLISRNLLMVQEMNPMRQVKVCRVYDVIRIFCTNEADKRSLFKDVRMQEEKGAASSDLEMIHRLCLHSDIDKFFSENQKGPRVRSFLSFRKDAVELSLEYISAIPESFPSLRILESKSIKFNQFPQRMTKLNHLRYIVLCVPDLNILPEPLSQLWNLQTIIVYTDSDSLTMKANMGKMMRLRHVKTTSVIFLEKKWLGEAGENLQTLNRVSPDSVPHISRRAINLKTLGIYGKLSPLFEDMHLGNLNRLEKLKLYQDAVPEHKLWYFPGSNDFPPNLKRLTLSGTFLEWKHMSTLANIHGLEVLKLKENAFTGIIWDAQSHSSFGKLQVLHMLNLDLVIWNASDSTFPSLRHLELKNCERLTAIPDGIVQTLESLDIGGVRKSIADSVSTWHSTGADLIA